MTSQNCQKTRNNTNAYPDLDIPTQPAVGVSHCRIKMVDDTDDTDNQKEVEMQRIKVLCALPGTHKLRYDEFHRKPPV